MRPTESMPTAGRLIAALLLGGLAYYASSIVIAIWPVEYNFGRFREVCGLTGVLMGWRVIGRRLGRGLMAGIGAGLTGLGAMLFWLFLLLSFNEMIGRSLDLRYTGPFEALNGMFEIGYSWALNIMHPRLWYLLGGGSMAVGLISELFSPKEKS